MELIRFALISLKTMKITFMMAILSVVIFIFCDKNNSTIVSQNTDPENTDPDFKSIVFSSPLPDSVSATDSLYIEVSCYNDIYNSLIKRIQIYSDHLLIREYTPPPMGIWWLFDGLKDNSIHSVYAIAFDSNDRFAKSTPKTVTVHVSPPPPSASYTPYLTIGNKWFYQYRSVTSTFNYESGTTLVSRDSAFITRQVMDTTSDGWRKILIKTIAKDSISTSNEYWKNFGGNIYILYGPNSVPIQFVHPVFISSLTHDSTSLDYSWKVEELDFFGTKHKTETQTYSPYHHNGGDKEDIGIAEDIGLVNIYYYGWFNIDSWTRTTSIVGAQLNGLLLGDTTNTMF
jgi:hypothetical protein